MEPGHELRTADDFKTAFLRQLPVEVWQDGELIDSGPIEKHIKNAVRINGMYYVKKHYLYLINSPYQLT